MSDTNTPVPNADEQAAAILRILNEAIAEGTRSASALAHVMEELADYAQGFPVLTHNPVRVKSYEYAVTAARLGAIAAELRGLAREQSPPSAPTNEQADSLASWLAEQASQAAGTSGEAAGRLLWASQLISALVDEDAPEGAPVHRAPTPIPIPLEGVPESARFNGRCWFGFWVHACSYWAWMFGTCTTTQARDLGYNHYLPGDIPSLPTNTPPAL